MAPRVLVAGIGNVFRRDDAFGSEVARALLRDALPAGVRVEDYGIRGMHLAYDLLDGYDALVIVDTVPPRGRPGELTTLQVGRDDLSGGDFDAHGMEPAAMLASLEMLGGRLPRTYVVGCQPAETGDGMGLSPPVAAAVPAAVGAVRELLARVLDDCSITTPEG